MPIFKNQEDRTQITTDLVQEYGKSSATEPDYLPSSPTSPMESRTHLSCKESTSSIPDSRKADVSRRTQHTHMAISDQEYPKCSSSLRQEPSC